MPASVGMDAELPAFGCFFKSHNKGCVLSCSKNRRIQYKQIARIHKVGNSLCIFTNRNLYGALYKINAAEYINITL